jgi:hypothetical protein
MAIWSSELARGRVAISTRALRRCGSWMIPSGSCSGAGFEVCGNPEEEPDLASIVALQRRFSRGVPLSSSQLK